MSQFRRRLLMMMQNQKKYGLLKPLGTISMFDFGVTWAQCNKIILKASGVDSLRQNMLFTGGEMQQPYIAIGTDAVIFSTLRDTGSYGFSTDIKNGIYFEIGLTFLATSQKNICNIWDSPWSKKIIYHEIMFYSNDTLLADFVPDITNSDRMYDKVSGTYIVASESGVYQLVEV